MAATLTEPLIVPEYSNGVIKLYTPNATTGAPTVNPAYTVNVTTILNNLFPGQSRIAAPNAVVLHGSDLFFTNSSSNSQAVFELPNYLNNPSAAIANAFVVTLDGGDYVGLTFDAAGNLYTAEGSGYPDNQIVRYTLPTAVPTGAARSADNYVSKTVIGNARPGGSTAYFGDLATDASGNLWAADYLNNRVVVFKAADLGTAGAPWHAITDVAGSLAVANTTAGLTANTGNLFAEPEGVAFDASGNLWVGNNNDGGGGVTNTLDSLVKITPALQALILATANNAAVSAGSIQANTNVFVYQVPNGTAGRPQLGGVQIDTTAGKLYATEEVAGDVRAYALSTIASIPTDPSSSLLPVTTTNPGNGGIALVTTALPCFREGTRLDGADGPVAVEAIRPGMRLETAAGELREVVWVGVSRVDCRRHPRPQDVLPVRVAAGALGAGLPRRDLWLSPDHALSLAGQLVPVRYLLNGATIVQEAAERVGYFHVELESHDILLAEGLPAESYLDTGNRGAFANGGTVAMAAPDFSMRVWEAEGCAPLCLGGPLLAAIRAEILAQAVRLGHRLSAEPALQLHAGGAVVAPDRVGDSLLFRLPPGTQRLRLCSRWFRPAEVEAWGTDHRVLGVAVVALRLDGVGLALDDPRLCGGWHAPEPALRWTDGEASISCQGSRILEVRLAGLGRYWLAEPASRAVAA